MRKSAGQNRAFSPLFLHRAQNGPKFRREESPDSSEKTEQVNQGEVIALIGANGAGKSTAIRLMLGLAKADGGIIELFGKPITEITLQDRQKIGVSLAESGFNGQFTIAELLGTITGNVPGQAGIFSGSIAVVLISYGISVRFMEKREI